MVSVTSLLRRRPRNLYVYGDESGNLGYTPYFLLGVAIVRNPEVHEREILRLRKRHGYLAELKYSNTDRRKLPFCRDLIDYLFDQPDFRFSGIVIDCSVYDVTHHDKFNSRIRPQDIAYNYRYKKLILSSTPPNDQLIVLLDKRTRAKADNLPKYLENQIPNLKNLQVVDSRKHELVQVADVLTGSVYGDVTGVEQLIKRAVIDVLKDKLGVDSLTAYRLRQESRRFRINVWRPPT